MPFNMNTFSKMWGIKTPKEAKEKKKNRPAEKEQDVVFVGRLGSYQYYDMDKVILAALEAVEKEV